MGIISIIAIQRAIQKILIAVFLTREYKHDETNRAWWTGKWYGRGLGTSAMSQPAREFIVKIVEMSLWGSDFLLAHILLMILTPPVLTPFANQLHSTMLCESFQIQVVIFLLMTLLVWLRPSKQIRAPLFSTKQKRQRRWIVRIVYHRTLSMPDTFAPSFQIIKYTIIYIIMISLLVALIALRMSINFRVYHVPNVLCPAAIFRSRITFNCSICKSI